MYFVRFSVDALSLGFTLFPQ